MTITETYINTIKVNGNPVNLDENGQFTLEPVNGEHNQFALWLMLLLPLFRVIGIEMSCGGLSEVQYCGRDGIMRGSR